MAVHKPAGDNARKGYSAFAAGGVHWPTKTPSGHYKQTAEEREANKKNRDAQKALFIADEVPEISRSRALLI